LVIGCAIQVHKELGPGLLESAYDECLNYELSKYDLKVERQKPLPLNYEQVKMECGYRAEFVIKQKVVLELKSDEALNDIHLAQMITYQKLAKCRLGLVVNFNVLKVISGVKRVVNNFYKEGVTVS
jgi:GxxExxY protein